MRSPGRNLFNPMAVLHGGNVTQSQCRKIRGVRVSQVKPSHCFRLNPTDFHLAIPVPVGV